MFRLKGKFASYVIGLCLFKENNCFCICRVNIIVSIDNNRNVNKIEIHTLRVLVAFKIWIIVKELTVPFILLRSLASDLRKFESIMLLFVAWKIYIQKCCCDYVFIAGNQIRMPNTKKKDMVYEKWHWIFEMCMVTLVHVLFNSWHRSQPIETNVIKCNSK